MFTNALLYSQDITALIRDTEPHERALFSVHSAQAQSRDDEKAAVDRRTTAFGISETDGAVRGTRVVPLGPRRNTAVAAVLGKDLAEKIRKGGGSRPTGWGCGSSDGREKGEVNVEILLQGAEKLSNV